MKFGEYNRMIDSLPDSGISEDERYSILLKSLLSNVELPSRLYWAENYFALAVNNNYPKLATVALDYFQVPKNLSLQQRIAYYELLGDNK